MTLLEVAVALTVAGAALAAGASALGFLADQQERTGARELASASAVRGTLRDWVAGARLSTEADAEFRGTTGADSANAELVFITRTGAPASPFSGPDAGTRIRIHIERADTAAVRGLVAELAPWRRRGATVVVPLAPDATGFQVRFLGSVFAKPVWQSSWITTSVLPAAVELRVSFASASPTASQALLALPMIVPLGARR